MTKEELLAMMRLLSALESWAFSQQIKLPGYLHANLEGLQERIQEEILK